ncbi:ATP-binding protein [Belliella sp. R4-6]|uniref:histidine kinase n=1 Tax=Belliella alkalica TaxID=1730871 RepID=A0ABS9V764_9BACT|nr:ATP-binding protein [Belliella alkalica]MCH7412259.1 ATP-binding protein [Belliella alkalica]
MSISKDNLFLKYPIVSGIMVFLLITGLQYFTVKDYDLKLDKESQFVNAQLNLIEKKISDALSNSLSTTRVLEYIENTYGIDGDFETIASELIKENRFIDAIQLVEGGTIKYVYPLEGNQAVIGYNILDNPETRDEALLAIQKKQLYFAGSLALKQGGIGIVGRNPIFKNGEFWGFSAVIIKFDAILEIADINLDVESPFYVQISKIDPKSDREVFFLPQPDKSYTGFKNEVILKEGDWRLCVQLKESKALKEVLPFFILRILLSAFLGYVAYYLTKLPSILQYTLDSRTRELKESNTRFELVSKATTDAIWDLDIKTGQVYRSENFTNLFGYPIDKSSSNFNFWKEHIHPEDRDKVQEDYIAIKNSTNEFWESAFRFKKKNGEYAYVLDKAILIRDKTGEPIRMIGATKDITTAKKSEHDLIQLSLQLADRAKKLEVSNTELEQFAYCASHDLQEPLRMITGFLNQLHKKYNDALDEKANLYIFYAIDGAKRMRQIILNLLDYSKVGNYDEKIEDVAIDQVLRNILVLFKRVIKEKKGNVSWSEMPIIRMEKTPINQIFQNLISNALKYSKPEVNPEVKIEYIEDPTNWIFSISDNGIGIESDHLEKIFILFQKLHSNDLYEGSGMGLTICKKIIEKYNGKIWVVSEYGEGSTFYFSIPKRK